MGCKRRFRGENRKAQGNATAGNRGQKRREVARNLQHHGSRMSAKNHAPQGQLALAPGAGSGVGRAFAEGLTARPDFVPALVQATMDGLRATRSYWSAADKRHITEPDFRTQLQAVALILANLEGEPVKRVVHEHLHAGNGGLDVTEALADSDAMREAMRRELMKADARASKRRPRKVEAAEPAEIVVE